MTLKSNITNFPTQLIEALGSEQPEFAVQTKYYKEKSGMVKILLFSLAWFSIAVGMILYIILTAINGGHINYRSKSFGGSRVKHIITQDNIWNDSSVYFLGFFALIGLLLMIFSLRGLYKKGGYFIVTKNHLYSFINNTLRIYDWKNFSKEVKLFHHKDGGSVVLGYTGDKQRAFVEKMQKISDFNTKKRGLLKEQKFSEEIHIAGIPNATELARFIKEKLSIIYI